MCLKYIGERESANEGVGYKELINIIRVKDDDSQRILVTAQMRYPVITDTWLLHKEPKKCTYKICCFESKADYRNSRIRNIKMATYNHGFHLWKEDHRTYCTRKNCSKKIFKVYYKDIIAEDDTQIVAKQIYICDKTTHPNQSLVKQEEQEHAEKIS